MLLTFSASFTVFILMYFIHYFYVSVTDAAPKCPVAELAAPSCPIPSDTQGCANRAVYCSSRPTLYLIEYSSARQDK